MGASTHVAVAMLLLFFPKGSTVIQAKEEVLQATPVGQSSTQSSVA